MCWLSYAYVLHCPAVQTRIVAQYVYTTLHYTCTSFPLAMSYSDVAGAQITRCDTGGSVNTIREDVKFSVKFVIVPKLLFL